MKCAIRVVEKCEYAWRFRFSWEKTEVMIFSQKKVTEGLKINGEQLEQVSTFRYLGVLFDTKLTWNVHINKRHIVLNVMRCLRGSEWGESRRSMKTTCIYSTN